MGANTTNTNSTGTSSSVSQKDPYGGSLPYLFNIANEATGLQGQVGNSIGQTYNQSFQTPYNVANSAGSNPTGITGDMQAPLDALGNIRNGTDAINTGGMFQNLYNQSQQPGQVQSNLGALAANPTGALTDVQQQILTDNAQRIAAEQASLYSGAGRYGSEGAGIGMVRGIAQTNNPLIAQFNQQGIQNSLAANQQISQDTLARMGIGYNAAQGKTNVQGQNISNKMNAANSQLNTYNQGVQRAQGWNAMQPQLFNMANTQIQQPWQDLAGYTGAMAGIAPYVANDGTQVTNSSSTGTGQTSVPTPWTTYAGLGLAGIGALSDVRLKTDIKKVGKSPWNNLDMYEWRYKWQPKDTPKFVGPMAQDVQKIDPDAVGELPSGILYLKGQK